MINYAPDFFWRSLYLKRWSSGAPFVSGPTAPNDDSNALAFQEGEKSNIDAYNNELASEFDDDDDPALHKLLGHPLPSSFLPPFTDSGISTNPIDWKYYSRQHAFNRIDWDSFPRDSKPVLALKPSLTGAIYRSNATSSQYGHVPIRSVRSEEVMRPLFQAGKIGYFEVHIRETGGEQVITIGLCSRYEF